MANSSITFSSNFVTKMHHFKPSPLCLLALVLILFPHNSTGINPFVSMCSSPGNYTGSGSFSSNLNQLILKLSTQAPPIGFGLGVVGHGRSRVSGLALCRGDVESAACRSCIRTAAAQIRHLCPYKKEAIVWFDNCLLRYSDVEFFGEVDTNHMFYRFNSLNVTNPLAFNGEVAQLMNHLTTKAHLSPLLFATGELEVGDRVKLYGLVQCTRDLSGGDCKICLQTAISELPSCCSGKRGGRVVYGSCSIRYELNAFYAS